MNRKIAAFALVAVAAFGLTACSSSPSASEDTKSESSSTEETATEETSTDQSVLDACTEFSTTLSEVGSDLSSFDVSAATSDPQAAVDAFNATVADIGAAADKVTNADVKPAVDGIYDSYVALADVYKRVLIDNDTSAATEISAVTTQISDAANEFATVCAG